MGADPGQPEPPWPSSDDTSPDPFRPRDGQPPGERRTPGRDWYPGMDWYPGREYQPPQYGEPRYPRAPSLPGSLPFAKQYSSREQACREPGDRYPVPGGGGHFILGLSPLTGRRPGVRHRVRNGMLVGLGLLIVIVAVGTGLAGAKLPSAAPRSRAASGPAAGPGSGSGHTLTYRVTGTPGAAVTYGPPGGMRTSRSPLRATTTLRRAPYYSITARLPGRGSVNCEIRIGSVISTSAAVGRHSLAFCQISWDPLSGKWQAVSGG